MFEPRDEPKQWSFNYQDPISLGLFIFFCVNFCWEIRDYYHKKNRRLASKVDEHKRNEQDLKIQLENLHH